MSFIALGLVNVRRNLGRSIVALGGVAVAALVVTAMLSLATSAPPGQRLTERFILGGDLIFTPHQVLTGAADLDPERVAAGGWEYTRPGHAAAGPLAEAVPWPWSYGHLAPAGRAEVATAFAWGEAPAALAAELAAHPELLGARVARVLPVLERRAVPGGEEWVRTYLSARAPAVDRRWWGDMLEGRLVSDGRYLEERDQGRLRAVVDARRAARGYAWTSVGGHLEVWLPAAGDGRVAGGAGALDYTNLEPVRLEVVGEIASVTELELVEGGDALPRHWSSGLVWVPEETLAALARRAGLAAAPAYAVVAKAEDLIGIDALAAELRRTHAQGDLSVFAARELATTLDRTGATAPLSGDILVGSIAAGLVPRALALDLHVLFAGLALAIAALIVAANLLVLLSERKREISILRALGATGGNVAVMVLAEAMFLTLAGCVLGFWPVRLLATITLVANRLSLGRIVALTLGDFAVVTGVALALVLPFGLMPAIAAIRTTPTEALRNE